MKKNLSMLAVVLMAGSLVGVTSCGEEPLEGTAAVVAEASKMTVAELEAAAKAEMEASTDTFKVVGLTSTLSKSNIETFISL